MVKPKLSDAEDRAIGKTFHEIARVNAMLDRELPGCPKIQITGDSMIGDTPDAIARFNAEMRLYIQKLELNNVN